MFATNLVAQDKNTHRAIILSPRVYPERMQNNTAVAKTPIRLQLQESFPQNTSTTAVEFLELTHTSHAKQAVGF